MPNYDQNEIDNFNQLASTWWDTTGDMKPLHDINPLRLSFVESHIVLNDKTMIDVGCGGGILTESLHKAGAKMTGVDRSEKLIEVAQLHAAEHSLAIDYQCEAIEDHATVHPSHYDAMTCMELLEHVPDPAALIKVCASMVKPGGTILFSTLNRNVKSYAFAIIGAEHILKMLPKGTHDYKKFIKPSELQNWCREAGLEPLNMKGMSYNPFTKTYKLSDDISVNYLLSARKKP